jgi:hypothetical protein
MELKDVVEFIEANKESDEVQEYLQGFQKEPSAEEILGKFDSDETLKKWLESERDKHATKAINTFKEKSVPKLVEEELKKRTSNKDEKDLQLDALRAEVESIKREKLKESLRNSSFKFASDNGLPTDLIDYFISIESEDDEKGTKSKELTETNLSKLKEIWSNSLQSSVNDRMKSNGFTPKDTGDTPKTFTREQIDSMSREEIDANWEAVKEALKTNN